MKADFSRNSFDPRKHYSAVLLQQGRVQIDADWNEQQQIHAHRAERVSADVIGSTGAPKTSPGFGFGFTADGTDLTLTPGRYYVDGLLCELDEGAVHSFTSNGDNTASLPLRRADLSDFAPGQWVLLNPEGGATQMLRVTSAMPTADAVTLTLSGTVTRPATPPTGAFGGRLQRITTYLTQPDLPRPALATPAANGRPAALALANGLYLVYLDVWQRHIGALDDPSIRETALGGPDTATRAKTVWQVKLLAVTAPAGQATACDTNFPEWQAIVGGGGGGLSARAAPAEGQAAPCLIPPGGGYQGLENQLYRLEIHDSGSDGAATFKWSRDNGSVVTKILGFDGSTLRVDGTGPDDALGLANGQWVEIVGDVEELQGRPGQLLQIATVNPATSTVSFAAPPNPIDAGLHPKLRRWDSAGPVPIPAGGGDWIDLELGVQVAFTSGSYASGDHWLVPARTAAAATVEWDHALPQAPLGVRHHFARLGLVNWTGSVASSTTGDCRPLFAPLTEVQPALHVTGINWQNDDVMQPAQFFTGLSLTLDGAPITNVSINGSPTPIPLMTASDDSMIVSIELPVAMPGTGAPMRLPVVLTSSSTTWDDKHGTLLWLPSPEAQNLVNSASATHGGDQPRVRVRLKGDVIWGDHGEQRRYLDGRARGQPGLSASSATSLRTDLVFPSGTGQRSSDFESWFKLQLAPTRPSLDALFASQPYLIGGGTLNVQAALTTLAQAPVGVSFTAVGQPPVTVSVNGNLPATIPAGSATVSVPVTVAPATTGGTVTVTATLPGDATPGVVTTRSLSFGVVVLAISVTPPSALLITGASLHFLASVSSVGTDLPSAVDTSVVWSCSGGTIDASGNYVAPDVGGQYSVTATCAADPSKSASATVNVRTKNKEKEKDGREKPVIDKAIRLEKSIVAEKLGDNLPRNQLGGLVRSGTAVLVSGQPAGGLQRSFIAPAERPAVGPAVAPADHPKPDA
jgi:hypothetical protein